MKLFAYRISLLHDIILNQTDHLHVGHTQVEGLVNIGVPHYSNIGHVYGAKVTLKIMKHESTDHRN